MKPAILLMFKHKERVQIILKNVKFCKVHFWPANAALTLPKAPSRAKIDERYLNLSNRPILFEEGAPRTALARQLSFRGHF